MKDIRRMSRYCVGYYWIEVLNSYLKRKGMGFGEYICVRKLKYDDDTYIGYFTLTHVTSNDFKFGQLMVEFEGGRLLQNSVILWKEEKKFIIEELESQYLLLDRRNEFPWLRVKGV
jgi:hypothetical protein